MSVEDNKALVKRWMAGGFKEFEAYADYLHENFTLYNQSASGWPAAWGREELEKWFREGLPERPTFSIVIEDIIAEGDTVATRATRFEQGKPVANEMAFYRFADGKIIEDWTCWNDIEQ